MTDGCKSWDTVTWVGPRSAGAQPEGAGRHGEPAGALGQGRPVHQAVCHPGTASTPELLGKSFVPKAATTWHICRRVFVMENCGSGQRLSPPTICHLVGRHCQTGCKSSKFYRYWQYCCSAIKMRVAPLHLEPFAVGVYASSKLSNWL